MVSPNIPETITDELALPAMSGTVFDRENKNAFLTPQTLFCYVGNPLKLQALLAIDEQNNEPVKPGQEVTLLIASVQEQTHTE